MNRIFYPFVFAFAVIVFLGPSSAMVVAQELNQWTEFRGPSGTGIATGNEFPTEIDDKDIVWSTKVHGKGWSSPVVYDQQVWLTTATEDGKQMSVLCMDLKSGNILLDQVLHENEEPDFSHPTNSYASPTPVIEKGRVFIHFGKYGTTCIDTKSLKTIWSRTDLECDHFRGPASSPILFEDLLIVAFDGADQQYVIAFNKANGKTVWRQDRAIDHGTENGDLKKAYGTASIIEVDDQPVLVYPSAIATEAFEPKTGKPLWTVYHGGMNVSARPLACPEGHLLITNGMGKMVAVDPTGSGNVTESHIKWTLAKGVSRKPSPLVIGNRFYMISDKGVASCYKTADGEVVWQERVGKAFSASPVFDGHAIFLCAENGDVIAIAAKDEFEQLGKSKLGSGFKATPAIVGGRMIFRSFGKLFCVKAQ